MVQLGLLGSSEERLFFLEEKNMLLFFFQLPLISSTGKSANDNRFFVGGVRFSLVD
jgi:hypothetical protein